MLISKLTGRISFLSIPEEEKRSMLLICGELDQEMERLRCMSENDVLGDWLNRRGLFRQADRIFSEYDREVYASVSVAFIDLDKFKAINDTYGHKCGDEIIIKVAEIIRTSIRKVDIYGRLSGDEFVVVLPGSTKEVAEDILKRIRKKFCSMDFSSNTEQLPVSASLTFGVVSTETDGDRTFEDLLHKADEVMNSHKGDRSRQ